LIRALLKTAAVLWILYVLVASVQQGAPDPQTIFFLCLPALAVLLFLRFSGGRSTRRGEVVDPAPVPPARRKSGALRWVSGFLMAFISGVAIWWSTRPGGSFVEGPPPPRPSVAIVEFEVPPPVRMNHTARARIVAFNQGSTMAQGCRMRWYSQGTDYAPALSGEFGLPPQQRHEVVIQTTIYQRSGMVRSHAIVMCRNAASASVMKEILIVP
jgi:hypothetical protein